jgi:hypothetical protein
LRVAKLTECRLFCLASGSSAGGGELEGHRAGWRADPPGPPRHEYVCSCCTGDGRGPHGLAPCGVSDSRAPSAPSAARFRTLRLSSWAINCSARKPETCSLGVSRVVTEIAGELCHASSNAWRIALSDMCAVSPYGRGQPEDPLESQVQSQFDLIDVLIHIENGPTSIAAIWAWIIGDDREAVESN